MDRPPRKRNSDKRKEKSRDAARSRRSRETEIFSALGRGLPLPHSVIKTLDKASIMRLVISYLKLNDLVASFGRKSLASSNIYDSLYMKSLEGFVVIISPEGDLVYLSENVNEYLGITQVDLMGNSIFEFSHPCDHDEIRDILAVKATADSWSKSFFLRLKCTLTNTGRYVNIKSANYKVLHCSGQMVKRCCTKNIKAEYESDECNAPAEQQYLIALAEPIPHPSNIEIPLDEQAFVSKHSLDMKFSYADSKMKQFLGYNSKDLLGKSLYEFHHALDASEFDKPFKALFAKGQCQTGRYRFLAKGGGYAWVVTQATLLYSGKSQKPSDVVCVNYIVSGIEDKDEIYSSNQLSERKEVHAIVSTSSVHCRMPEDVKVEAPVLSGTSPVHVRPQPATASIFAPRTEEMNKGYLMFSDEEPGVTTVVKDDELEADLTHLAPMPGDVCIPIQLSDFSDFPFDSYYPLLIDHDLSSSSFPSRTSGDPFFSYREDSNSAQSPSDFAKSTDDGSLPSLSSPEDGDDRMGLLDLNVDSCGSELDEDLTLKTAYPLDDDLPILIPAVDTMWGAEAPSPHRPESTLAQLLKANQDTGKPSRSIKRTDHDWLMDTGQCKSSKQSPTLSKAEQLHRKKSPGAEPPFDRVGTKRSHGGDVSECSERKKRTRSDVPTQLLHQLVDSPLKHGSVLMNLLEKLPKDTLGVVTDVLNQLYLASRGRSNDEPEMEMSSISSSLLKPGTSAIPSLLDLSQRDCEVNAPVDRDTLLRGQELIFALEEKAAVGSINSKYLG